MVMTTDGRETTTHRTVGVTTLMEDHGAAGGARDLEGGGGATRKPGTHGEGVNCDGTDAADRISSHSGTHWDGASLDGELEEKVIAAVEGTAGTPAPPAAAASGTARSLPAPPPSSSIAVIGVSLAFLQAQLEKINHDDTLTTADMVYQVIIPLLKTIPNRRCTFVEGCHPRPYPDDPESFGRATAFVSHAWRCSFAKLVSALARREQGRWRSAGTEYYWLDIYSKDQFIINSAHTADELTNVVRATGRLLLIMDPWHGPLCFTRVWCLFEIMWALRYDAEVEIALPGDQIDDFLNDLSVNGYDRVNSLLATIDAKKGEASFPDDIPLILGMIETSVGFDALNRTVVEELRRNFSSIVLSYSRSWARSTVEAAIVKVRVSELMLQLGNCVSARDVAAEALADLGTSAEGSGNRGKSDGGNDSCQELAALSVLARVNENEKNHDDAIRLFRRCYVGYSSNTEFAELSLEAARRLGYTLTAAGRPGEGAVFLQAAVDGWRTKSETDDGLSRDQDILSILALRGLSEAHREDGDFEKARAGYEHVVQRFTDAPGYGSEHRRTLAAAHGLGKTLMMSATAANAVGDTAAALLQDARELLRETLVVQEIRLGTNHGDTLKCRFDVARVAARLGDWSAALGHLERGVECGWVGAWHAAEIERHTGKGGDFELAAHGGADPGRFAALLLASKGVASEKPDE